SLGRGLRDRNEVSEPSCIVLALHFCLLVAPELEHFCYTLVQDNSSTTHLMDLCSRISPRFQLRGHIHYWPLAGFLEVNNCNFPVAVSQARSLYIIITIFVCKLFLTACASRNSFIAAFRSPFPTSA